MCRRACVALTWLHASARGVALWLGCSSALVLVAPSAHASDVLDPYRTLARSPAGAALLAEARRAMAAHFDGDEESAANSTAADSGPASRGGSMHADSSAARSVSAAVECIAGWPGAPVTIYVSLVDAGATRACVGTETPLGSTLNETVRVLAVQALQADRRRPPVRRDELGHLRLVLAFADEGTPIADPMTIAPARDGLLIRTPRGSIAFLPGEARTVAYMLREARRIGLVRDLREASFMRLQVVTLSEPRAPAAGSLHRTDEDAP